MGLTPELRGRESVRFLFPLNDLLGNAFAAAEWIELIYLIN